jgi:hypothetical protein
MECIFSFFLYALYIPSFSYSHLRIFFPPSFPVTGFVSFHHFAVRQGALPVVESDYFQAVFGAPLLVVPVQESNGSHSGSHFWDLPAALRSLAKTGGRWVRDRCWYLRHSRRPWSHRKSSIFIRILYEKSSLLALVMSLLVRFLSAFEFFIGAI